MNALLDQGSPISDASGALQLPTEVSLQVLEFFTWGDLARLACTQRSYAPLLRTSAVSADQAAKNNARRWDLAQALLRGKDGLAMNKARAVELLRELANVPIDPDTHAPMMIATSSAATAPPNAAKSTTTCCFFAPAMRLIADLYLDGEIRAPEIAVAAAGGEATTAPTSGNSSPSLSSAATDGSDVTLDTTSASATGSTPNVALGVQWLQSAFELGNDIEAAHHLALLYERGHRIVELDVYKAAEWLQKASEHGHVEAMAELGLCYELGCGVPQSDENALEWYMKAAERGSLVAKYSVGEAFEEARGVPLSLEEACLWYYKAAQDGDDDAKKALRRLFDVARIVLPGVGALLDG
jgi:TPR repeat protein